MINKSSQQDQDTEQFVTINEKEFLPIKSLFILTSVNKWYICTIRKNQ